MQQPNLAVVNTSFANVAARVAAARAQKGVSPETYPLSGADTALSRPGWFHSPYEGTSAANINSGLPVTETGDAAHRNPLLSVDDPTPIALARANSTAVTAGQLVTFTNGQTYIVSTSGTTAAAQPSTTGVNIGDNLTDGTAVLRRKN